MASRVPFYKSPFGTNGDLTPIPDAVQTDGSLSYPQGWGPDYQRDQQTDPLAKDIDRRQMNQVFNTITALLRQYQSEAFPEFIGSDDNGGVAFPYDIGTVVRWRGSLSGPFTNYVSLVTSNTATPADSTKWQPLVLQTASPAEAQGGLAIDRLISPFALAQSFLRSMAGSGFFRTPGANPFMVQWGQFTQQDVGNAAVPFTITLASSFPNNGLQGWITAGNGIGGGAAVNASIEGFSKTTIGGFTYSPVGTRIYRYLVIGY